MTTPNTPAPRLAPHSAPRLAWLFRAHAVAPGTHPLQRALFAHRGAAADAPAPTQAMPPANVAAAVAALPPPLQEAEVRRRVTELPPLPQAAMRAMRTLQRDDASLDMVAADLGTDASLAARVLRLANSPFYGVPGRVGTLRDAVQLLGRRTLESLLTMAAVGSAAADLRCGAFDHSSFWRHELASAIAARALARGAGLDESLAFVSGLLHDIGMLALSAYFPAHLQALLALSHASDQDAHVVEARHGLTPHADIGAWVAAHWHFPAAAVHAIAQHHAPHDPSKPSIAACVHVADVIAHALDLSNDPHERVPAVNGAAWKAVAPAEAALDALLRETEDGVQALCQALVL